ncbi:uncharacterized protein LOC100177500 [Ciona intestinalis]
MKLLLLFLLCFPNYLQAALVDPTPKFMQDIGVSYNPAFCSILENTGQVSSNGAAVIDVGVSSFTGAVSVSDHVLSINGVQEYIETESFSLDTLTDQLHWPNEVSQVPDGIFNNRVWAVASGFFLPGKDDGSIALMDVSDKSNTAPVIISNQAEGEKWFYHRVLWMDMNKDGHLDAVTARAYGTGAAAEASQLVWFENPGFKYLTPSWQLHVLHEGTEDVAFRIHHMTLPGGSTTPVIISAGFWSFELGLTWSATGDWEDASSIRHMAVDNYGWYFDLQIVDVNMDGRLDVLCTTWSQLGSPGALLAYEIPDDWQNEPWTRHVLQTGYKDFPLPGSGSPGSATAFWPLASMESAGVKPYVMVTGDDDGQGYVVTANTEDPDDWTYSSVTIYSDGRGTVGAIAVGDVDGDGATEVFLPLYEKRSVRVMTYLQ